MIGNSGAIAARFDINEKGLKMDDWHQYGHHGIPFQNYYMDRYQTFRTQLKDLPPGQQEAALAEVEAKFRSLLEARYGAFFAGSESTSE